QRDNRSTLQSDQVPNIKGASYAYDSRNRLTQVTTEDGKAVSYRYNGDNLMVERTEGGVTTRYYYDDRAKIVAEGKVEGNSVTITAAYVHDSNGKLLARQVPGQGMQYYVSNGHGDITEVRDAQGNVLNRYTYDIWGNPLVQEEQVPNIFRYSGEYWDEATNLQYLRARWYDPSIGRFVNEDTYEGELGNPLTLNLYTYVQNNPLKYIDPSGNRYIPSEMNSILKATMKVTSTESRAYSYAYDLLSREYADVYDTNRFNYLFGLLTQTSAYKNSAGNADWARAELAKDYSKWHQEISFAEALASLGPVIGGIGKAREVGGKVRAIGGCNCFTAGTKVLTDDGEKNIEDIAVGDKVLAKDENNPDGELAYKEVTGLYRNQRDDIIKLNVGEQIIETTDNHPFWVEEKGWVFADELQVGDKLQKADGSNLIIDKVEFVNLDEPVTVYNFTVADYHTYYVTDLGIWVHNTNCKNTTTLWDIKTGADKKISYKFNGDTVTAYRDPKTGLWWSKDTTGHADSAYKVFKEAKGGKELHWVADSDKFGNYIDGKHKSSTGTVIKIK
ncbi:polymorphic toxin-type HINT domain-containing protein, partial [Paenibacillus alvei]|uniref:polymorphic toxin-type HINT domain-containing protein n=1 Tax=Paenibacillus alvei TaxID=44250 RepID=UPI00227FDE1B